MKFSDGYWLTAPGYDLFYASEPYEIDVCEHSIHVLATQNLTNRGQTLGGPDIHDAQLDAVFIDQTDFRVPDLLIDRQFLGSDGSTPPKKIADANAPTTK